MRNILKSKERITYKGRTVYQESKAFAFTYSNICKIWKGQAPRVYNGERIELYPISGKAPGPLAPHMKGLIMNKLSSIEKNLNILFPQSYKNTLDKFKLFMEIEFNNYQIDLFNEESLFDNLNGFPQWCYLKYLVEINKEKQQMPNIVERHDSNGYIDSERVKRGLLFGSLADGARVYFDLEDDFSIWEYWLDDGSIGKVADTFDEILEYGKIIDFE